MAQDLLNILEKALSEFGHRLRIKYGLGKDPSSDQIHRWHEQVKQLIRQGYSAEQAGESAASAVFVDFRTHVYASEAETISYLLDSLNRNGRND